MAASRLLRDGLVSYSGSSSEDEEDSSNNSQESVQGVKRAACVNTTDNIPAKKIRNTVVDSRCVLPSVPDGIISMFGGESASHDDDSAAHGGRVRTFAHERGNWATYVYAQVPEPSITSMKDLTESLIDVLTDETNVQFQAITDLHLTLSRTLVLRHHWIEDLMSSLRTSLSKHQRLWCSFHLPRFYCNDEKTRTFLGFQVESGSEKLVPVVETINKCLGEYRLPPYYKEPSFHVSLAWALGDVTGLITDAVQEKLKEEVEEWLSVYGEAGILQVEGLCCKTGNKIYRFPLR